VSHKPPPSKAQKTRAIEAVPLSTRRHGVLTIANGIETGRVLRLKDSEIVTLGRAPECTYSFDDESLSREHAAVVWGGGVYIFKDTSTNGSFVNDARVTSTVMLKDGDRVQLGSNTLLRFALVDPTEEAALLRVYEGAILDGLTRVFNRKHLEERIVLALEAALRDAVPLSIIMIDVDHFKKVNDTYGHLGGDAVLKSVASLLTRQAGEDRIVARYGGEEFCVIAPNAELEETRALAEQMRAAVAAEVIPFEEHAIRVTSSAGVASLACCADQRDRTTLLGIADRRLYAAKQGGRNRVIASDT
jgi:diguanylate cyclase (GGDEF)-like protein